MILTTDQEAALLKIIQRELDAPAQEALLAQKQADLDDVNARLAESKREAEWNVLSAYIPELTAKQQAVEDAKTAITADVKIVTEVVK